MQIATHNPFSVLSNKKIRPDVDRIEKVKDTKPTQRKEAPKKEGKKAEAKKEEPKKDSKVVSITDVSKQEELQKQLAKEQEKADKEAKKERDRTDKHDRSGKAHIVRKEGKGVGGWDDNKVEPEPVADVVPEETDAEEKKESPKEKDHGKTPEELAAEAKNREEEAKQRELEDKQMTLEEYKAKQKENAPPPASFSIRQVDTSGFKGMVAKEKDKGEVKFQIGGEKAKKPAPKKDDKKKEEKEKVQVDVGFRMENPTRQGKGKGEGKGGKGGRGRGGYSQSRDEDAPKVDDESAFPALGGARAAAEGEASA